MEERRQIKGDNSEISIKKYRSFKHGIQRSCRQLKNSYYNKNVLK